MNTQFCKYQENVQSVRSPEKHAAIQYTNKILQSRGVNQTAERHGDTHKRP